jgi:WD40 repeat protein
MSEPAPLVEVLLRQREAWQAGGRPSVEEMLRQFPHLADDTDAVLDLIYNETVLREERGTVGTLNEYLSRFPHLEAQLRVQFEVDGALTMEDIAHPRKQAGGRLDGSTAPVQPASPGAIDLPRLQGIELLGELGRGAMGVVYRAWQRGARRLVAVKLLSSDMPVGRAVNEVEAASRLTHPNIVGVYEVNEYQGRMALVLEFVEGGNLAQKLTGRPQSPRDSARLVETLAGAMAYAHGRGVVHRDLKPSNVLLAGDVESPLAQCIPKIGDFGLAKLLTSLSGTRGEAHLTHTTDILGTPSYMAPEQTGSGDGPVGPAADVYSLGAILYECLTGRPPFLGQGVLDTLEQVRHQEPVPPSRLQPQVPRDLEIICLKCLHKTPGRRYGSARELADDLKHFLAHEPIDARAVGLPERVWKWARRRPAAAALVLVSLAATVLLAGSVLSFNHVLRRQRDDASNQAVRLDDELRRTRQLLYTTQLLRVGSVWESDPVQGLQMLEDPGACPPDLRCFSWGVLHSLCKRYRRALNGHSGAVTAVTFSGDGKLLASGGSDGPVRLWDVVGGKFLGLLREHVGPVSSLVFSSDGELLVSAGNDGKVCIWDFQGRKLRGTLTPGKGRVAGIAFHPDGRTLAANSARGENAATVTLWDVRTLKLRRTLRGETSPNCGVAISPDGSTVVCAGTDNALRTWSTQTGRESKPMPGHAAPVTCLVFSRSGRRLASGSLDGTVRSWDVVQQSAIDTLEVGTGPVTALAFHPAEQPEGQTLAVAGQVPADGSAGDAAPDVQLWDLQARRGGEPLRGHPGGVASLAFAPDGKTLATGGADRTIKLWDYPPGREEVSLRAHAGTPGSISLSRDGRMLAWVSRGNQPGAPGTQLAVYDLVRGTYSAVLPGHGGQLRCLALSPDGSLLASAAGGDDEPAELLVWEVATGRLVQALSTPAESVMALAFHAGEKALASAGRDGSVKLWNIETGKARFEAKASIKPALALALSRDGRSLAVGGGSDGHTGAIDVWDTATGTLQRSVETPEAVRSLAITPEGCMIAHAGTGGEVHLVDVPGGEVRAELAIGMKRVACIAFSPDGRTLAVAGSSSGVKLWDVATVQERASLPRHRGGAYFVGFSDDGLLLVSASATQVGRLWYSGVR